MTRTKVRWGLLAMFTAAAAFGIFMIWSPYEPYSETRELPDRVNFPGGGVYITLPAEVVFEDNLGLWVEGGVPEKIHKVSNPELFAAAATGGSIGGGSSDGVSVTVSTVSGSLIGIYVNEIKSSEGAHGGVKRIYVARMAQPGHLVTYVEWYFLPNSHWTLESFSNDEMALSYDNFIAVRFLSIIIAFALVILSLLIFKATKRGHGDASNPPYGFPPYGFPGTKMGGVDGFPGTKMGGMDGFPGTKMGGG